MAMWEGPLVGLHVWPHHGPSYLSRSSKEAGSLAALSEAKKSNRYKGSTPLFHFVPICAETLGAWGPRAIAFLNKVGEKIRETSGEPRSTSFLFQRLSVAITRGNAASILGTYPAAPPLEEVSLL